MKNTKSTTRLCRALAAYQKFIRDIGGIPDPIKQPKAMAWLQHLANEIEAADGDAR